MIARKFYSSAFIILVLIQLIHFSLQAQDIDSLSRPKVFLKDEFIQHENFPAISKDGKTIVLIHSDYSCCVETQEEFRIVKTKGSILQYKIITSMYERKPDFSHNKKINIVKQVNDIIKKQPYRSMVQVSSPVNSYSFPMEKASSPNTYYLNFTYDEVKYSSDKFKLNKMKQTGYCCTAEVNDPPCMIEPSAVEVWMDLKSKFLLIGAGNNFGPDGCELGPKHIVVKFKQQK